MKKYRYLVALAALLLPQVTNTYVTAETAPQTNSSIIDPLFQAKVKKLQNSVKVSWNPISTIRNKSYRLPTLKQYRERLQIAIQVLNTTGKTKLLTQTCAIGYQSSWVKKHKFLNAAVETVKFAPHLACASAVVALNPRLLRNFHPSRILERFHID